jgi:1,4-dihydroxy-2-naphthoate octaprenyltransferase
LFVGAGICFLFAALAGAYLIHRAGWPLVWIGLFSIVCAIAYTAGPMPLAYFGLGDLFVLVFFGFIAVGGAFFTQTLQLDLTVLILGAIAGLQGVSLIAVNNIRDIPTDKKAGKKTFAVLIGEENAKAEYLLSALIPFLLVVLLAIYWADSRLLLPLILLPLVYKKLHSNGTY